MVKFDAFERKLEQAGLESWLIVLLALTLLPTLAMAAPSLSPEEANLAQQDPIVRIQPIQSTVTVSQSFTVSLMIDDAYDLGGFQFDLLYITATVRVDDVTVSEFISSTGRTAIVLGPDIYHEQGKVTFGVYTRGHNPGPNGTGELAVVSLTTQGAGVSPLDLQRVQVVDAQGDSQVVTVQDGSVTSSPPTAVTLASFTATAGNGQVLLKWETASEINNIGFNLWRNTSEADYGAKLNGGSLIRSKALGSVVGTYYDYTDTGVINGTAYYYWLESVATDGGRKFHGPKSAMPMAQWTATPTATATATATLTPSPTSTPTSPPTATSRPTRTVTRTPTRIPPPPVSTATGTPTPTPLPTATGVPQPTSTPTSIAAAALTETPTVTSPPITTPATPEITSPIITATATRLATVTLSPTPPLDRTTTPSSPRPPTATPVSPTHPPTVTALPPITPQPLMGTTPAPPSPPPSTPMATVLSVPRQTPTPTATGGPLPIQRRSAGLGHLWLVGAVLVAAAAGLAWLAYSLIRRGHY